MLENYNVESILFLDIETVPMVPDYNDLPDNFKKLWDRKAESLARYGQPTPEMPVPGPAEVFERAGIYAEFGKIVCISTGVYRNSVAWIKSFYGDDEKVLLEEFVSFLVKLSAKNVQFLCAHNGKEFDFPYMIRRMLVNGVKVPADSRSFREKAMGGEPCGYDGALEIRRLQELHLPGTAGNAFRHPHSQGRYRRQGCGPCLL